MMYPRLRLAKDLLREDGVIFISIDDGEVANLRCLADSILGGDNFINNVIWEKKYTRANDAKWFSDNHDHILVYAKNKSLCTLNLVPRTAEQLSSYKNPDEHIKGRWKATPLHAKSGTNANPYQFSNGVTWTPPRGTYRRFNDESMHKMDEGDEIWFGESGSQTPSRKSFLCEVKDGVTPVTIWGYKDVGHNHEAANEVNNLRLKGFFSNPKPSRLIKQCLTLTSAPNDLILDFFSGSATTAHAVMQLNAEDGGSRKHIMVQLPEVCDAKSEAAKAGYKTIAEIGKDRIRRAGEKIVAELRAQKAELEKKGELELEDQQQTNPYILNPDSLDIGFKSFRIEDTKINWLKKDLRDEEFNFDTAAISDKDALDFVPGATDHDVVYELMLRQSNIPLTLPITQPVSGASRTYLYGDAYLICLEEEISNTLVASLAALEPTPLKYFFRDSAFGKDIAFKDETFRRLNAEIAKNTADQADAYTVEFI
jgi:adenine-specific DNA-methyltransferase